MNKERQLRAASVWRIALVLAILACPACAPAQRQADQATVPGNRVVSLRVLQERARQCMVAGRCPEIIRFFCDLRRVNGYVIDAGNTDILLIGDTNADFPPLHLEDFVIALRNVWWKYAPLHDNTYYYSSPGCTIDPDPEVLQQLMDLRDAMNSGAGDMDRTLNEWREICDQPQTVGVFGIPFHSRFAKVMVDADYLMKTIVNGSREMEIEGFRSLMDMSLDEYRDGVLRGEPVAISMMNRFWFYPGENLYTEAPGILLITRCDVQLLTEEEHLTHGGAVTGTGQPNPLAKIFTQSFSERYQQIADREPIYKELEDLFRFVALAKLMKEYKAPVESGLELGYFMDGFPVLDTPVDSTLPGLSNVKWTEHRRDMPGGYELLTLTLPSCGGVSIDFTIDKGNVQPDPSGSAGPIKNVVLASRPAPDTLFWDLVK
jgi:hypothetical protein